jgi:SAM-dependent methyltransferase
VKQAIAHQLLSLNRQFYSDFGALFSDTRRRNQPGVLRILDSLKGNERILDLGCGNGELARALAGRGHFGAYLGLDFSLSLLAEAKSPPSSFPAIFAEADLTTDWETVVENELAKRGPGDEIGQFELITSFATLHHIPSLELRTRFIKKVGAFLLPQGCFIHSNWQFLNSPRLRERVQTWSEVGLTESDVDPGDYLLDWRAGGRGLRYVHHFSEAELAEMAAGSGFHILETFYSDGKEGNLAIYQIWRKQHQNH